MICEVCNINPSDQRHHLFSQTKVNKRLYPEYIHHPLNIKEICNKCHLNKPIPKFSEREFCQALGIEPRSKTEKLRKY